MNSSIAIVCALIAVIVAGGSIVEAASTVAPAVQLTRQTLQNDDTAELMVDTFTPLKRMMQAEVLELINGKNVKSISEFPKQCS